MGAPRSRASAGTRCHVTCGAAGAPLSPVPLPFGTRGPWVLSWRGGEAWGCGFPRLGFPPGAPLSEAPPFRVRIIGRGANPSSFTHFIRSLGATARRPFSFVWAAALRVPPPKSPRRSLNTPVSPRVCVKTGRKIGIGPEGGDVVRWALGEQSWPGGSR